MQELKTNEMHKPERCSNCMFNTKAPCGLYFCNNGDSELYHKTTGYDMSCEQWTEKTERSKVK